MGVSFHVKSLSASPVRLERSRVLLSRFGPHVACTQHHRIYNVLHASLVPGASNKPIHDTILSTNNHSSSKTPYKPFPQACHHAAFDTVERLYAHFTGYFHERERN